MRKKLESFFKNNYNTQPIRVKAPGRINIIGEHTDYNLGFVLPAAIDKGIYFAVQKANDDDIKVETFLDFPASITFSLQGNANAFSVSWGKYIQAILQLLYQKNYPIEGFNCAFAGDIPIGAGLSSSAALCCGFLFSVSELFGLKMSKSEIALLAQQAEHLVGLNCGLMDQYAVLFGKKNNALLLDCNDLSLQYIPIDLVGYKWILINSNIKHELAADSAYNDRRVSCENVVTRAKQEKHSINSLRDIDFNLLEFIKKDVSKTDYQRAKYVLEENDRVKQILKAFQQNDPVQVGNILSKGHKGLSQEYGVSTPEIDFLVATAVKTKGVLGARMMGGGFGGCTINLIKNENVLETVSVILSNYKKETGITANYYELQIGDGVKRV